MEIKVERLRAYQQMEKEYSACCRCDGLHEDACTKILCHATLDASNKSQIPQIQDKWLDTPGRQANQHHLFSRNI